MKKIKVYLQYPWKFPDSPYYKYLLQSPPKNIEYLNVENQKGVITKPGKLFLSHQVKRNIRKIINFFRIPIINAHLTKSKKDYDLIHCSHCLSKNKNRPWIADFEGVWQFYLGNESPYLKKKVKDLLFNENCKKIVTWTSAAEKRILSEFPEIKDKIEIVYPAMPLPKIKRKEHEGINLLFIARYFSRKGGVQALEAIDRLTKKYKNVHAIFISETPKNKLKKYFKNSKIKFYGLMPQKKLFEEIYPISDIFVYPGYKDSFGFAMLEALSFGIPVVTVKGFARRELIEEGKTGFVIDKDVTISEREKPKKDVEDEIVKKTSLIIEDKRLREKMSKNCINAVKEGRFSIKERNKKLERIYVEALKE